MRAQELDKGDYVIINFGAEARPQLAEVVDVDRNNNIIELLPEENNDTIRIIQPDQWRHIFPCSLNCQMLRALGFSEICLDIAYGWTVTMWSKTSWNRKNIFNLEFRNHVWELEVLWLENTESLPQKYDSIIWLHQLQQILRLYDSIVLPTV